MCKDCAENSSYTYSRCNPLVSSQCVSYQGDTKECISDTNFKICKGEIMSNVQEAIFDKICSLSGQVDVSQVVIPACLIEAWDKQDLTILNLFNLALEQECLLKAQIDTLTAELDYNNPIIKGLNFCCCSVDCNTSTAEIRLSDALTQIIECVCNAKAQAEQALSLANSAQDSVNALQTQIDALEAFKTTQTSLNIDLQLRLLAVENKTACLPDCP